MQMFELPGREGRKICIELQRAVEIDGHALQPRKFCFAPFALYFQQRVSCYAWICDIDTSLHVREENLLISKREIDIIQR